MEIYSGFEPILHLYTAVDPLLCMAKSSQWPTHNTRTGAALATTHRQNHTRIPVVGYATPPVNEGYVN